MKIASHHSWKDADYTPRHDWPGDTLVQWGGKGIVLGKSPYNTAFFEAFPDKSISTAGGFIRGEGLFGITDHPPKATATDAFIASILPSPDTENGVNNADH